MSRKDKPFTDGTPAMNTVSITGQMLTGAGIAGGIVFGSWAFIAGLAWLGTFLPPESKEAVDPTPDSFVNRVME